MKKILALLKKDIRLQARNWKEILFTIIAAVGIIYILNLSNTVDFNVGIDNNLKDSIAFDKDGKSILVNFLDSDIPINTSFDSRENLEEKLKNNRYPVIVFEDKGDVTLKMNNKDPKGLLTYFMMSRYFNGVKEDNFKSDYMTSTSNTTLIMVITLILVMGGSSKGSSVIFQEKNDGTLNILYKSGLSSAGIIIAKTVFTILVMIFIFFVLGIYTHFTGNLVMITGIKDVFYLAFILIPIAIMGNFTGIIAKTIEENKTYQFLLFVPALFYPNLASRIPVDYLWLARLHPGIAVIDFYERAIDGNFDVILFSAIAAISCILFVVNVFVLRKAAEKSING